MIAAFERGVRIALELGQRGSHAAAERQLAAVETYADVPPQTRGQLAELTCVCALF